MPCEGLIDADILFDCDNSPVGGLETDVLLFNEADIDLDAITYDAANKDIVTNFQLLSGKTGFLLEGVKQINSASSELVKKEFSSDKHKHVFNGVVLNVSAANKKQINSMAEGTKYVAIIDRKYKGAANVEAFLIESTENYEEPRLPNTLLETDYPTTKAAFDAKFAQA